MLPSNAGQRHRGQGPQHMGTWSGQTRHVTRGHPSRQTRGPPHTPAAHAGCGGLGEGHAGCPSLGLPSLACPASELDTGPCVNTGDFPWRLMRASPGRNHHLFRCGIPGLRLQGGLRSPRPRETRVLLCSRETSRDSHVGPHRPPGSRRAASASWVGPCSKLRTCGEHRAGEGNAYSSTPGRRAGNTSCGEKQQAWAWGGTHGGRSVSVAGVGDEQPQYLVCPPAGGSFVRNNHTELRQSRRGREPQVGPPLGQKAWLGAQVDRLPRAVAQDRRPNLSVPQHPSCRAGGGTSSPRNSECSAGPRSVSTGYLPWRFSSLSR